MWIKVRFSKDVIDMLLLRIAISHEKQEIKEFYDKKFLTRKTGKKNKKLMKVKKALKSIVQRAFIKRFFENLLQT